MVAVGIAYASSGRDTQALQVLGRAAERFPESPTCISALGHVWLTLAERHSDRVALSKAIEALTAAATHATTSSAALSDLGRALTLAGDYPGAERALRQAVTRLPASTERSYAWRRSPNVRDACPKRATPCSNTPRSSANREPVAALATRIADLSLRIGEPLLAARWLDRAIDENGPSPALLASLADAAWKGGDQGRAREAVTAGLQLAPDHPALLALRRRVGADPRLPERIAEDVEREHDRGPKHDRELRCGAF